MQLDLSAVGTNKRSDDFGSNRTKKGTILKDRISDPHMCKSTSRQFDIPVVYLEI